MKDQQMQHGCSFGGYKAKMIKGFKMVIRISNLPDAV